MSKLWFLLFPIIFAACSSDTNETNSVPLLSEQDDNIEFSFLDVNDNVVKFSDWHDGQPVVLNFFASWCPSCVAEMPDFQVVAEANPTVSFLGLAMQDQKLLALELVEETGVTYDIGFDNEGAVFRQVEALGMPTTVFIDGNGSVLSVHSGIFNAENLQNEINKFFG